MKQCSKCKTEYPATNEYFSKNKNAKDGLFVWCKPCKKENDKQYFQTPKGKAILTKALKKYQQTDKFTQTLKKYYHEGKGKSTRKKYTYEKSGVYGIFSNGKCLYVGESSRINVRFNEHKTYINNPTSKWLKKRGMTELYLNLSQHPALVIGVIEQTENHKERESFYINKYQPLYNKKQ